MLRLAAPQAGARLLDPCCGAGTILIEAAAEGLHARGGDIAPEALKAARANVDAAGVVVDVQRWDARRLPLADASVECVVSNPPWGRAVAADMDLDAFYRRLCDEIHRVLRPGGHAVLLTGVPDLVRLPGMQLKTRLEISLFGQRPLILAFL